MIELTYSSTIVLPRFSVITIRIGSSILGFKFNFLTMLYDLNEYVHPKLNCKIAEICWIKIIPWTRLLRAPSLTLTTFRIVGTALFSLTLFPTCEPLHVILLSFTDMPTLANKINLFFLLPLLIVLIFPLLTVVVIVLYILLSCLWMISDIFVIVNTNCTLDLTLFERLNLFIQNSFR